MSIKQILTRTTRATRYENGAYREIEEVLIDDIFLELQLNGRNINNIITIDEDLDLLAAGTFYHSLNIEPALIKEGLKLEDNRACLTVAPERVKEYTPSCCCSFTNEEIKRKPLPPLLDSQVKGEIQPELVLDSFASFEQSSKLFKATAGVHGAALFRGDGEPIRFFKDIARHNCIMKAAGYIILHYDELCHEKELFLIASCRLNAEIVKMVESTGIKLLITRASISNQALLEARRANLSLVGFVKESRFTIFNR